MATQADNKPTPAEVQAASNKQEAEQPIPDSARTNGEKRGENAGTVGVTEERSFNERTAVGQPFILEDGTQDNGARDLDKIDGAKGKSVREGNNTVREDTRIAIKDGKLPASDQPKGTVGDEKSDEEKVRNPVN